MYVVKNNNYYDTRIVLTNINHQPAIKLIYTLITSTWTIKYYSKFFKFQTTLSFLSIIILHPYIDIFKKNNSSLYLSIYTL